MTRFIGSWMSRAQRADMWKRWKEGETVTSIAGVLGKLPGNVYQVLAAGGGIAPVPPKRADHTLTLANREDISRGLAKGWSMRAIARALARPASTICREVGRHGGREAYRACDADEAAWASAQRPKKCRLACNRRLRKTVASRLKLDWSPEQISAWLARAHGGDADMQVSHETIYKSLFIQARGVLKKELLAHLRISRRMRKSGAALKRRGDASYVKDAPSIRERPAESADRAVPGHWEGDLISGSGNSHIVTLVERSTRFTIMVKLPSKETSVVVAALTKCIKKLPAQLRQSLTWDRGTELASHKHFTIATNVKVYFCDPHSPWQRGSNENTNGLLRQYLPKGTNLSVHSQAELDRFARRLNERPRKTLGFDTPAARMVQAVVSTD